MAGDRSRAKIAHMAKPITDGAAIGERIAEARQTVGISQADLAVHLGVDRTAVVKIESGNRKVSATELVTIAAALDRPIDWFVFESPPTVLSRRNDPLVGGRSTILDLRIDRLARDVEFLEKEEILPIAGRAKIGVPENIADAEVAARKTRSLMEVPTGPLIDLQRHCEQLGLLAFSLNLGEAAGDAAYVALDTSGVALINGAVDPGRRRFNLAHELAHHLFADAYAPEVTVGPGGEAERLINVFAVNLLLPREDVEKTWQEFDEPRLAAVALAVRFRVSWTAVCAQLKNLEVIDSDQREAFVAQPPTKADFMELGEHWIAELVPPSVPPDYGRRVLASYRAGKLTGARTVELLWDTVSEEELPSRHEIPLEGFRREFEQLP